jgi:hypothetical protein
MVAQSRNTDLVVMYPDIPPTSNGSSVSKNPKDLHRHFVEKSKNSTNLARV